MQVLSTSFNGKKKTSAKVGVYMMGTLSRRKNIMKYFYIVLKVYSLSISRYASSASPSSSTSIPVENVNPLLTLNEWLRSQTGLTGTKRMCAEGGCGCCVVAATRVDPVTQKETTIAVNSVHTTSKIMSCLFLLLQSHIFSICSVCVPCSLWKGGASPLWRELEGSLDPANYRSLQ